MPVILAAGKGTRLGLTDIPKPLATVCEKPIIEKGVAVLYRMGLSSDSILCVIGHLGHRIKSYFGGDMKYVHQTRLDGNLGAIKTALETVPPSISDILVIQGDDCEFLSPSLLQQFIHFHNRRNSFISILLTNQVDEETHRLEFLLEYYGRIVGIIPRSSTDSEGNFVTGVYLLNCEFLNQVINNFFQDREEDFSEETGIFELFKYALAHNIPMYGMRTKHTYVSINSQKGLVKARYRTRSARDH